MLKIFFIGLKLFARDAMKLARKALDWAMDWAIAFVMLMLCAVAFVWIGEKISGIPVAAGDSLFYVIGPLAALILVAVLFGVIARVIYERGLRELERQNKPPHDNGESSAAHSAGVVQ